MGSFVAAMKRSVIEVGRRHLANDPEYASLLPGYGLTGCLQYVSTSIFDSMTFSTH